MPLLRPPVKTFLASSGKSTIGPSLQTILPVPMEQGLYGILFTTRCKMQTILQTLPLIQQCSIPYFHMIQEKLNLTNLFRYGVTAVNLVCGNLITSNNPTPGISSIGPT